MPTAKIAITIDHTLVEQLNTLVEKQIYPSRSRAIQEAIAEKLSKLNKSRLARECTKLDKNFEQSMAEEGLSMEMVSWPEY